jgi:acyl-coenzyme A synthetase/AMP-(fatty) acid ligase
MKKIILSFLVFALFAGTAIAQDRTITGTVTGKEDGLPIPGVSVKVQGTQKGTQIKNNMRNLCAWPFSFPSRMFPGAWAAPLER